MTLSSLPVSSDLKPIAASHRAELIFWLACLLLSAPLLFAERFSGAVVAALALAALILFAWRGLQTRTLLPPTPVNAANLVLLLALPIGWWASTDHATSLPVIARALAGFITFYGFANLAGSRWMRWLPWLWLILAGVLGVMLLFSVQWATTKLPFLPSGLYTLLPTLRMPWQPEGFHPNVVGAAIGWLFLLSLALAVWANQPDQRWLRRCAALVTLFLALVLLLSQSRGAWLGVLMALVLIPALRFPRWRKGLLVVLAVAVLVITLVGPMQAARLILPDATARETGINTLPGRIELWQRGLIMLRDFGLAGIGPGQFEPLARVLYPPFYIGLQSNFHHVHNLYLQTALDFGVLALIALLALLLGSGISLATALMPWPSPTMQATGLPALAVGIFGSLIAFSVHGLLDAPQVAAPNYWLIFALLGTAAAIIVHLRRAAAAQG